jgi:hypothetical protein
MEKFDSYSSKKFKLAFRVPNNCDMYYRFRFHRDKSCNLVTFVSFFLLQFGKFGLTFEVSNIFGLAGVNTLDFEQPSSIIKQTQVTHEKSVVKM